MASTTISRPTLTDDDGSGTTGGILNSTNFGLWIYDKVDLLFTGSLRQEATIAGALEFTVQNTNTGTSSYAAINVGNSSSYYQSQLIQYSTGYTTSGSAKQDGLLVTSAGAGGLTLRSSHASGGVAVSTNAADDVAKFVPTGQLVLKELTSNAGTSDCAADAALALYTKADTLVFAYNNGGTMTYLTLALDGTTTTWSHGTTAP